MTAWPQINSQTGRCVFLHLMGMDATVVMLKTIKELMSAMEV